MAEDRMKVLETARELLRTNRYLAIEQVSRGRVTADYLDLLLKMQAVLELVEKAIAEERQPKMTA